MKNRIDFTEEMKAQMKAWKGQMFHDYIENGDDGYVTVVRFNIGDKSFDLDNEYMCYQYSDGDEEELSCFSCVKADRNREITPIAINGKCATKAVEERIRDIYIVSDHTKYVLKKTRETVYEFPYETALMIETETRFYVFWRHIIFDTINVAVCKNYKCALAAIENVKRRQKQLEPDEGEIVIVDRTVKRLD